MSDPPAGMTLGSERRRLIEGNRPVTDPRLGQVRCAVAVSEDGKDFYFACSCGWFMQGRSRQRGITHAQSCPHAQPAQMSVDEALGGDAA